MATPYTYQHTSTVRSKKFRDSKMALKYRRSIYSRTNKKDFANYWDFLSAK